MDGKLWKKHFQEKKCYWCVITNYKVNVPLIMGFGDELVNDTKIKGNKTKQKNPEQMEKRQVLAQGLCMGCGWGQLYKKDIA